VTIILGGDSLLHKKRPRNQLRVATTPCSAARVRQDGDSAGDPRTRLDNLFVYAMLVFVFLYE
jgi:hypothetical protein